MIFVDLTVRNESDKALPGPEAILHQIVTYTGERQIQRKQELIVAQVLEPVLIAGESLRNFPLSLQIPGPAPPTMTNCKYISIQYQLFVHCGGNSLEMLCPMVIG